MAKAIDKQYLINSLKGFDTNILEPKYTNVIEEVQVNGTALTVTDKSVNVEIPAAVQYKIAQQATAEAGYLKTYTLQANTGDQGAYVDVAGAAKINIPKDFLVKSATLETVSVDDQPVAGYVVGDKYLDFVINTKGDAEAETDVHIYINVKDLFNPYTAGHGLVLSGNEFAAVAKTNGGLGVDANGIYVNVKANGGLVADATGLYIDFEDTNIDFTNWNTTP